MPFCIIALILRFRFVVVSIRYLKGSKPMSLLKCHFEHTAQITKVKAKVFSNFRKLVEKKFPALKPSEVIQNYLQW